MKLKILSSATQDLIQGFKFYEKQAEGIGNYFLETLYAEIDSLTETVGIHPIYFKTYHRLLSKRFPFAVYYQIDNNVTYIYAVLDCRKNPALTRQKLGGKSPKNKRK